MRRTLFRVTVGAMVAVVAAGLAGSAFAAKGHSFGPRMGFHGMRAGGFGPAGLFGGGPMMFGPGPFGARGFAIGIGGPGGPGGPGGGGVLTSDVLTPAAAFLSISVQTLTGDLAGGKTLAQEATAKGKTASDLIDAIVKSQQTNLDNEKAAGWITADQETAILAKYKDAVTDLVNNGPPVPPAEKAGVGGPLQTAATFLGMSVSDLQAALKSGKSLADVAKDKGKSVDDLVTALLAPAKTKLDQAVTDKQITQAQETAILNHMTTALTNLVNNTKPSETKMNGVRMSLLKYTMLHAFIKHH
jgi:hypothetical protein